MLRNRVQERLHPLIAFQNISRGLKLLKSIGSKPLLNESCFTYPWRPKSLSSLIRSIGPWMENSLSMNVIYLSPERKS